jgi:RNA polymerase sigma-70 factor (ECF subfamily)
VAEADDDELMALVQRRDQAAFGRLISRHLTSVHRYLRRLTGSASDADELSQETFLRLWQRAGSYRPGTVKLTTWLHRIAHNLAIDELRRRRPETREVDEPVADESAGPEDLAASSETGRHLHAAISALPANQRSALLLCQVQGFSNRDAAAILGITVRGLESLVARARRTLRAVLLETPEHGDHHGDQKGSRGS